MNPELRKRRRQLSHELSGIVDDMMSRRGVDVQTLAAQANIAETELRSMLECRSLWTYTRLRDALRVLGTDLDAELLAKADELTKEIQSWHN